MQTILKSLLQPRQLVTLIILIERITILIPIQITMTVMLQLFGVMIILQLTQQVAWPQCNGTHSRNPLHNYLLLRAMINSLTPVQISKKFASMSHLIRRRAPEMRAARRFTSNSELHLCTIVIGEFFLSRLYLVEQCALVHLIVELFWLVAL